MKPQRLLILTGIGLALGIFIGTIAHAGFIDDWITARSETSPGYFEGQKRGYFTGGSFSARWPMNNDHLLSVQAPRIKAGCGGIDLFMGGMSFLNFDWLVQKLQNILQAAPAAAFDLALKTLCEPCSNVMAKMEDMADKLNNLQIDECHDSKVLTAKIFSAFTDNNKVKAQAQEEFSLQSGLKDFWSSFTADVKSTDGASQVNNENAMFTGCSNEARQIFLMAGHSVLENIASSRGYPIEHVELMRGLVGDLSVEQTTDDNGNVNIQFIPVPACPGNSAATLDDLFNGTIQYRPLGSTGGDCPVVTDVNRSLATWTMDRLNNVYNALSTKGALTAEDVTFIDNTPLVYRNLILAISTKQGDQVKIELADMAAKAYAYGMLRDMYTQVSYNYNLAKQALARQAQNPRVECQVDILTANLPYFQEMEAKAQTYLEGAKQSYIATLQEHKVLLDVAKRYEEFTSQTYDKLSQAFSGPLANRVMKGM